MKTTTIGTHLDANGYSLDVRLQGASYSTGVALSANGSAVIPGLTAGDYLLSLFDVIPNCHADVLSPRVVSVGADSATSVDVNVTCAAPTQIAFANALGDVEIQVINSDGTGRTQLTFAPGFDSKAAWSPDGKRIAFVSQRHNSPGQGNLAIFVMDANGQNPTRLSSSGNDDSPTWSPDGSRIAFSSARDGNEEIYAMDADGSNPVRLTTHQATDLNPAWSPDGGKIAFASYRDGIFGIWVMNADGSGVKRLTTNNFGDAQPAWSPDGTRIAFAGGLSPNTSSIFIINADGSSRTRLTQDVDSYNPAWSPDGRKIAFSDSPCSDYYHCVYLVRIVGLDGIPYSLTINNASDPAWRP